MQHIPIKHEQGLAFPSIFSSLSFPGRDLPAFILLPFSCPFPCFKVKLSARDSSHCLSSSHPGWSTKVMEAYIPLGLFVEKQLRQFLLENQTEAEEDEAGQSREFLSVEHVIEWERENCNKLQKGGKPPTGHTLAEFFSCRSSIVYALLTSEGI